MITTNTLNNTTHTNENNKFYNYLLKSATTNSLERIHYKELANTIQNNFSKNKSRSKWENE